MRYLKTLGLLAIAVAAVSAVIGASAASATVLCKTATNPCSEDYAAGTEFQLELVPEWDMKWEVEEKTGADTCQGSSLTGKSENTGGSTSTVVIGIAGLNWTSCSSWTREVLKTGSLEIQYHPTKAILANVTIKNTEWKVVGLGCTYSVGSGLFMGVITEPEFGTTEAQLDVDFWVPKVAGSLLCAPKVKWLAKYTVTAPEPLHVSQS